MLHNRLSKLTKPGAVLLLGCVVLISTTFSAAAAQSIPPSATPTDRPTDRPTSPSIVTAKPPGASTSTPLPVTRIVFPTRTGTKSPASPTLRLVTSTRTPTPTASSEAQTPASPTLTPTAASTTAATSETPTSKPTLTPIANTGSTGDLLNSATTNTFAASNVTFDLNGDFTVAVDVDEAVFSVKGSGCWVDLSDPQKLTLQATLNLTQNYQDKTRTVIYEVRAVGGTFYLHGVEAATGVQTPWYRATLYELVLGTLASGSNPIIKSLLSGTPTAETMPIDPGEFLALADVLSKFIRTTRTDTSGDEAIFNTRYDVQRFLRSKDGLPTLIKLIAKLGGVNLGEGADNIGAMTSLIPLFVPEADLRSETHVDPAQVKLNRVNVFGSMTLGKLLFGLSATDDVIIDLTGGMKFTGYGAACNVSAPADSVPYSGAIALSSPVAK